MGGLMGAANGQPMEGQLTGAVGGQQGQPTGE